MSDGHGTRGNTDDKERGRGLGPGGRVTEKGKDDTGVPPLPDKVEGNKIGGRHRAK